jgi:hypothetical protein
MAQVHRYAREVGSPGERQRLQTLTASASLLAYERGLHEEAVCRLSAALGDV